MPTSDEGIPVAVAPPTGAGGVSQAFAADLAAPTAPAVSFAPTGAASNPTPPDGYPPSGPDQTYLMQQVFLGGDTYVSPFNDYAVAPLTDMVYANDEVSDQMGCHIAGAVPTNGSSYNGGW